MLGRTDCPGLVWVRIPKEDAEAGYDPHKVDLREVALKF